MTRTTRRVLTLGVFVAGAIVGSAVSARRPTPPPSSPPEPTAAERTAGKAERFADTRSRTTSQILGRLADGEVSGHARRELILGLGHLETPDAVAWLVTNHDCFIPDPAPGGSGYERRPYPHPSVSALLQSRLSAVPLVVTRYITVPGARWPEGFLQTLESSDQVARVAYLYAQGYLFMKKEDGHHRDAVIRLIDRLSHKLHNRGLPFPPPWFGAPEWKRP